MHHHLGFEQPDRLGLNGLFALLEPEPVQPAPRTAAAAATPVGTSRGARSAGTRNALARFQGWLDEQRSDDDVATAAA